MNEDNQYDHLETVYINLNFEMTSNKSEPSVKNFAASPAITHKASNQPYKARSLPVTYETLSEKDKALYDRCKADAMVPNSTRLERKLFDQVANTTAAFNEKPLSVTQSEFEAYRKQFALSEEEERLQEKLFAQVAGQVVVVE